MEDTHQEPQEPPSFMSAPPPSSLAPSQRRDELSQNSKSRENDLFAQKRHIAKEHQQLWQQETPSISVPASPSQGDEPSNNITSRNEDLFAHKRRIATERHRQQQQQRLTNDDAETFSSNNNAPNSSSARTRSHDDLFAQKRGAAQGITIMERPPQQRSTDDDLFAHKRWGGDQGGGLSVVPAPAPAPRDNDDVETGKNQMDNEDATMTSNKDDDLFAHKRKRVVVVSSNVPSSVFKKGGGAGAVAVLEDPNTTTTVMPDPLLSAAAVTVGKPQPDASQEEGLSEQDGNEEAPSQGRSRTAHEKSSRGKAADIPTPPTLKPHSRDNPEHRFSVARRFVRQSLVGDPSQKRRFLWIIFTVGFVCAVVAVAIGLAVGLVKNGGGDDGVIGVKVTTTSPSKSPSPSLSPTSRASTMVEVVVRARLVEMIPARFISDSSEAFDLAVMWYANDDPSATRMSEDEADTSWIVRSIESGQFLQRFILAWLWFHSTKLGMSPWFSCNPLIGMEPSPDDDACDERTIESTTELGAIQFTFRSSIRYMSTRHECEWVYVSCLDGTMDVAGLRFVAIEMVGTYPNFITLIPTLKTVEISYNDITGPLPSDLSTWRNLTAIVHDSTQLEGPLPDELFELTNLEQLIVTRTPGLSGTVPTKIGQLTKLTDLQLSRLPGIRGTLPTELGELKQLQALVMSNLNLGLSSIPSEIGVLDKLKWLDLSANGLGLSQIIPQSFENLMNIEFFDLSRNGLRGELPNLNIPSAVFFSVERNRLSGNIPDSLYVNDGGMKNLLLSRNQFDGSISEMIGNFEKLEEAFFSFNQLTGPIPVVLGTLSNLSSLRLERNNFEGAVPSDICVLQNIFNLEEIGADCRMLPDNTIETECMCCSVCCADGDRSICGP